MASLKLWGKFGNALEFGSVPPPRFYFIQAVGPHPGEGPLAEQLGHALDEAPGRSFDQITTELDRAVSGEYDAVIFPAGVFQLDYRDELYGRCRARGLRIVFQVTSHSLSTAFAPSLLEELMRRLDAGDAVNFVFGGTSVPKESWVARLSRWPEQIYFTYSVRKTDSTIDLLHRLQPFVRERLFFHFPYHLRVGDGHLSCRQIFDLIGRIHSRVPGVHVRPPLGIENYDPRIDPELEIEPLCGPRWSHFVHTHRHLAGESTPLDVSVIIPTYNNQDYVLNTCRHLLRQSLDRSKFEIIVVDDGSTDGTENTLKAEMSAETDRVNFKFVYSPRKKPRKMGDANYRAGISRNLGVKNARGRLLCFLDSDILTPTNFLEDLIVKHQTYDVVQCKRRNLHESKSNSTVRFESIDPQKDVFSTENGYWDQFYRTARWNAIPFYWKYTCTYGLSLPMSLFKRIGWIKRGFIFYGFEDVELGYRLAKTGARFHLSEMTTYHLFHQTDRSEFYNSDFLRQSLLAKTAQIFFLGNLDPEIFVHFRGLMKEQGRFGLDGVFAALSRSLGVTPNPQSILSKLALAGHNRRWFAWHLVQTLRRCSRVLVPARSLTSAIPAWRVAVWIERLVAHLHLWRIRVFIEVSYSRLELWRIRVMALRLRSALELWRLKILLADVRSTVWAKVWPRTYPVRKLYYFTAYQVRTRLLPEGSQRTVRED